MNLLRRLSLHLIRALPPSQTVTGYEDAELLDLVRDGTRAARELTPMSHIPGARAVLDFGGGFGLHYRRACLTVPDVRWAVVEVPALVEKAQEIATDRLRFFTSTEAAANWLGALDTIYSEGALQYTDRPEAHLTALCGLGAAKMIWARTMLTSGERTSYTQIKLLAESGPELSFSRKRIATPTIRMNDRAFVEAHRDYELIERSGNHGEGENFVFSGGKNRARARQ